MRTVKGGKLVSGVYQSKTNGVVSTDTCMLNTEKANEIIASVRALLKSFKLRPYNPYDGSGFFKHVLVRQGFQSGEIMVVLVTSTITFPAKNNFVKALLKEHPDITTIVLNVNDHPYKMMLGPAEKTLYGKGYITDTLCGGPLRYRRVPSTRSIPSRRSFFITRRLKWRALPEKKS